MNTSLQLHQTFSVTRPAAAPRLTLVERLAAAIARFTRHDDLAALAYGAAKYNGARD